MDRSKITYSILKATLDALIEAAPGVVKAPAKFVSSLAEQLKDKSKKEGEPLEQVIRGIPKGELEAMIKEAGCDQKESIDFIVRAVGRIPDLFQKIEEQIKGLKEDHEEIKRFLKSMLRESLPTPLQFPLPPSLHNQTPPEPNFVGRRDELSTITQWYRDPNVHIGVLVGWGGFGKSALARKWFDLLKRNKIHPDGIFWYGFYRNPYLDRFLDALVSYLSEKTDLKTSWQKVDEIKRHLTEREYLIILDGLEEMQEQKEGERYGFMKHPEFVDLLKFIADADFRGLCLVTTRTHLTELKTYPQYKEQEVERLSTEDGIELLTKIGVRGTQEEKKSLVKEYDGHTLSLTLLANYLVKDFSGNIKEARKIPAFYSDREAGGKAHRILWWYDKHLSKDQRTFMRIFSLFRGAVGDYEFGKVFRGYIKLSDFHFKELVRDLKDRRLIQKEEDRYTTHPLIKGYFEQSFAEEERKECHKKIYQYFGEIAKDEPKTLEEMKPYFEQVYHGCSAGLYDEVLYDVYWEKIYRREERFIIHKLGAWETNLSLAKTFFPQGGLSKMPQVSKKEAQSWLLAAAGLALLSIGRPKEAEELLRRHNEIKIELKDWENASVGYRNLADLRFRMGKLESALNSAEEALKMAEKADDNIEIMKSKAYLGQILYLLGKSKEAEENFERADELAMKISGYRLYSIWGVFYADFLISAQRIDEASDLTQQNLKIVTQLHGINDISRCHRVLSAICRIKKDYKEAEEHLNTSIEIAKDVGMPYLEIEALIEVAKLYLEKKDIKSAIDTAEQILNLCKRTGFKLYEPDAELILSKAYLKKAPQKSKHYAESASQKAKEMGYKPVEKETLRLL
jgi:tetratricopeptide (TPR) repeat protein